MMSLDRRIRALRPPKPHIDPLRAHGSVVETERRPGGTTELSLTVFLAGAECPFTCAFCDLWRWTIDGPTPNGSIPAQLESVLSNLEASSPQRLKLYNASNFFDRRAIPPGDLPRIAALAAPFAAVTVESHANMVGTSALAFAESIPGRLEVAMGLETIHPLAMRESNKHLDLGRFDDAARFLVRGGVDVRVFVLLGVPHVAAEESVAWTVRTVQHAVEQGASVVSIIPVRGGNGELERLQASGAFTPPTLGQLETALDACMQFDACVVTADLWDIERLPGCADCRLLRIERLQHINLTGCAPAPVVCSRCNVR